MVEKARRSFRGSGGPYDLIIACTVLTISALLPPLMVRWPMTVMAAFFSILFVAGRIIASAHWSAGRYYLEQVWNELTTTGELGPHPIYDDDTGV